MSKRSIAFKKMHGSGNDFILIDNRDGAIKASEAPSLAAMLCRRRFGIGADGLILIEPSQRADFKWQFFNADGSEAEMCGNGGRCAARFAFISGVCGAELTFETIAGVIRATVMGTRVKLELTPPTDVVLDQWLEIHGKERHVASINTGVPHAVLFTQDLDSTPVFEWGRLIRHHSHFSTAGTNVNFVKVEGPSQIAIRTYERGVEGETMACGTGAVASAIISAMKGFVVPPVSVKTWGGEELVIYFEMDGPTVKEVFLEGDTVLVYSGLLDGDI